MENITYEYLQDTKTYEIKKFDKTLHDYEMWVKDNFHTEVVITDEDIYKGIYKERTALRKEIEAIKKDRKAVEGIIIGTFESQCKEIINVLQEVDDKLTKNLEEFKPKEQVYEFKFKTKDKEEYDLIVKAVTEILERRK